MSSLTKKQESIQNCWSPKQHTSGFRISDPQEHKRWFTISGPPNNTCQEGIQNFFFFWGGGGNLWALACAITTTTETSTTYKCCLFKTGDFLCSKAPLVLRSRLEAWYCLAQGFFLFLPEIIICSFNNNEVRNAPMAKLFISYIII